MMTIYVCMFVFIAGFMDSIAGGGGLISLPAYLMTGYPIHLMLGTNKSSSTFGTFVATIHYFRSGNIHLKTALTSAVFAFVGSFAGASLSLILDAKLLKLVVVILLPLVCLFISRNLGKKRGGETSKLHRHYLILASILGLMVGFYDGMLGPGTGTFLIIGYTAMGFSMTAANGNAKLVNLFSNIAAFTRFFLSGNIMWSLGIPAAVCGIAGNWLGSKLAITKGERIIRPFLYIMVGILFVTFLMELM